MAWLLVFFPALIYYVSTRLATLGLFRGSSYGEVIETSLIDVGNCQNVQKNLLYTNKDCTSLKYPMYMVRDDFEGVVATTWKHDEELGRGYLLLSTSHQHGRIWQWETGGGPIPIGRTLSMVDSGCRSNLNRNCSEEKSGSGGIIIDSLQEPHRLIVAEWGEGRISRLEENGARTPLIIQLDRGVVRKDSEDEPYSEVTTNDIPERLNRPFSLLITPFGDLLVLDSSSESGDFLWQLRQINKVPGLESLSISRKAHGWRQLQGDSPPLPDLLMRSQTLGGMALVPNSWLQVYVTMHQDDAVVVVTLSLEEEEEDMEDEDDDEVVLEGSTKPKTDRQSAILLDYSRYATKPGPIEVDEKGNLYLAVDGGILFVSSSGTVLGKLSMPNMSIVDITLGEDRFLYIATESKLFRFSLRNKLLTVPTNLVVK